MDDAHRIIQNGNATLRRYASQIDVVHPDLWLTEPVIQVISLTANGSGGVNSSESRIDLVETNGLSAGTKGLRSSLILAGDVTLDGKVDAADLQVSISQLGTNPQALGVMPITDMNGDQVVDSTDIGMLLASYGNTTDIYEGLWDGSRLLSVVAAHAGFGSLTGGTFSGSGSVSPGLRPIDDCPNRSHEPPDNGPSMVPALLRQDSNTSCGECPGPNDPDPQGCWECEDYGTLTGGQVTSSPDQPKPGDMIVFTASGVTDSGGQEKCTCGDETREISPVSPANYAWQIVTRNADGSWPDPDPDDWQAGSTTDPIVGVACTEYRAYFSASVDRDCPPDSIIINGNAQVADFEYKVTAYADGQERTRVGVGEFVKIELMPPGTTGTARRISGPGGNPISRDGGRYFNFKAPTNTTASTTVIELTVGGCRREVTINTVLPNKIIMHQQPGLFHNATEASAGLKWCIQAGPTDVSFRYIYLYEGATMSPVTATGSLAVFGGYTHLPWTTDVGCDNFAESIDGAYSGSIPPPGGNPNAYVAGAFSVSIGWHWRPTLGGPVRPKFDDLLVTSTLTGTGTMTHTKGTLSSGPIPFGPPPAGLPWTGATCPMYNEPADNFAQCP